MNQLEPTIGSASDFVIDQDRVHAAINAALHSQCRCVTTEDMLRMQESRERQRQERQNLAGSMMRVM